MVSKKNIKTLVVAAFQKELVSLCDMGRRHLVVNEDVAYLAAGIGPVAASFGLTHCLKSYRPEVIVTLGTAGTFKPDDIKIGDISIANRSSMASGFADCYAAKNTQMEHDITVGELSKYTERLSHFNKVSVYCPQEITSSKKWADQLSQSFDTENLEVYSFQFISQKFGIPILSLLGISNVVGPTGHDEWVAHEKAVSEALGQTVQSLL